MGGFNFNIPGINFNPQMLQNIQRGANLSLGMVPATPAPAAAAPRPTPTLTGMAANYSPSSGPMTDEARVAQAEADAQTRQALQNAGVDVQGMSPQQYQATIQALGEWRNLPENRAYRDQTSAIGAFVDSIGGPAGLFALSLAAIAAPSILGGQAAAPAAGAAPSVTAPTAGSLMAPPAAAAGTGASGAGAFNLAAGTGLSGAGAAGGGINLAATGIPAFTGATGAGTTATGLGTLGAASAVPAVGGGILGGASPAAGAINIGAGTGAASTAAGSINLAATGMPAFAPGVATTGAGTLGGIGSAVAAPSAPLTMAGLTGATSPAAGTVNLGAAGLGAAAPAVSTTAPLTMSGLVGGTSPAAGGINLGAAGLGASAPAVSTTAPLTMGGLLGGTSPAAGSINLGAAGLGTAAGGAGMGGISGFLNSAGNFLSSPGGRLLSTLGEAGLSYLGGQDEMDLARELAAQSQFRPYNIQGPLGNVDIQGQQINISPTQQQAALQQQLFGLSSGALGRAQDPALMNIFAGLPGQVSNLTQQFIGQETGIPGAARTLEQQLAGIGTESLGMGRGFLGQAGALPSAAGAITPFVGGPGPTSPGEALASQAAGASLGLLGEGTAGARDISGTLAGAGGELLRGATAGAPSFNQLATERLTALREAARPAEERTTQAALERLFSQGRLGTTGGARVLGELSRAQELADIQRVTSAQDFAQNQQNVALENALRRGELGLSALGGAMGGSQFLAGAGADLLGLGAEAGLQGRTLAQRAREANLNAILGGVGTDIEAALGQGRLGTQLYGLGAGMPATIFDAQRLADEAALNRGAQRIAAAEGLFGFGQNARTSELGMGLDVMNAQRMQFDPLIQLTNIASGMGGAQSLAAARGAQGVMGSFASPYDYGAGIFGRYAG